MCLFSFIGSDYLAFRPPSETSSRFLDPILGAGPGGVKRYFPVDGGCGHPVKSHPRIRGGYAVRGLSLVLGLFLFALGVVLILWSGLGLSPWDVLSQGISNHTPLSFGQANICVGTAVMLLGWALGGTIGIGTVANAVLIGTFIDRLTDAADFSGEPLGVRVLLLLAGLWLIGPGSALYIGADFGAGPRDTLMLVGSRITGRRVGIVRAGIELCALAAGVALGGTFGIGTILFAVLVGPIVESSFWLLEQTPFTVPSPDPVPVVIAE